MFVFAKGRMKTVNLIRDKPNKFAGTITRSNKYNKNGERKGRAVYQVAKFGKRTNLWKLHHDNQGEIAHPAAFPRSLPEGHILSWSNRGDLILDPFGGSGTTGLVARQLERRWIMIEQNSEFFEHAKQRLIT